MRGVDDQAHNKPRRRPRSAATAQAAQSVAPSARIRAAPTGRCWACKHRSPRSTPKSACRAQDGAHDETGRHDWKSDETQRRRTSPRRSCGRMLYTPPPSAPKAYHHSSHATTPRRPDLRCAPHTALGHFRLPWAGGGWGRLDARRAPRRAHDLGRQRAAYLAVNANTNVNATATSPHLPTPPAAPRPCSRGVRRQSADRAAPATTTRLAAPDAPSPPLFNSTPRRRPRDRHAPRPCPMPHAPSLPSRPATPSPHAAIGRSIGPITSTVASSRAASTAESAPPPSHPPHPHPPPLPAPPEPPPRHPRPTVAAGASLLERVAPTVGHHDVVASPPPPPPLPSSIPPPRPPAQRTRTLAVTTAAWRQRKGTAETSLGGHGGFASARSHICSRRRDGHLRVPTERRSPLLC